MPANKKAATAACPTPDSRVHLEDTLSSCRLQPKSSRHKNQDALSLEGVEAVKDAITKLQALKLWPKAGGKIAGSAGSQKFPANFEAGYRKRGLELV